MAKTEKSKKAEKFGKSIKLWLLKNDSNQAKLSETLGISHGYMRRIAAGIEFPSEKLFDSINEILYPNRAKLGK